jgi:hypothetical protein
MYIPFDGESKHIAGTPPPSHPYTHHVANRHVKACVCVGGGDIHFMKALLGASALLLPTGVTTNGCGRGCHRVTNLAPQVVRCTVGPGVALAGGAFRTYLPYSQ